MCGTESFGRDAVLSIVALTNSNFWGLETHLHGVGEEI